LILSTGDARRPSSQFLRDEDHLQPHGSFGLLMAPCDTARFLTLTTVGKLYSPPRPSSIEKKGRCGREHMNAIFWMACWPGTRQTMRHSSQQNGHRNVTCSGKGFPRRYSFPLSRHLTGHPEDWYIMRVIHKFLHHEVHELLRFSPCEQSACSVKN